jgi:predicted adenylyl cyclase CyaB
MIAFRVEWDFFWVRRCGGIMPRMNSAPSVDRSEPRSNIELKARLRSLQEARAVAAAMADQRLPDQHQVDTYFVCSSGRLKLREIRGERAELIAYHRPDDSNPKASRYFLLPVADSEETKAALSLTLGVKSCVEKHREIYLYRNVRIHLDQVRGLGTFLEFEAVLDDDHREVESRQTVEELRGRFAIREEDLLENSYGEMIEAAGQASR